MRISIRLIGVFSLILGSCDEFEIVLRDEASILQGIRIAADSANAELQKALLDKNGELNAEIVVLLNTVPIPLSKLSHTALNDGDVLTLIPIVAGG